MAYIAPDGTTVMPFTTVKPNQAGETGLNSGTPLPIYVPPGTDPNSFIALGNEINSYGQGLSFSVGAVAGYFTPGTGYDPKTQIDSIYDQWGNVAHGLAGATAGVPTSILQAGGDAAHLKTTGQFPNLPVNKQAIQLGATLANPGYKIIVIPTILPGKLGGA